MQLNTNLTSIELNSFLISEQFPQFLQSWQWGEFQKALGKNVWRLGISENNQLLAVCQVIENKLPLSKSYLYAPRGPIFKNGLSTADKEIILKIIFKEIRDLTIETKTKDEIFLKIEPPVKNEELTNKNLLLKKVKSIQPKDTLILDLNKSEGALLSEMHPKTRYNIRLAEKKRVVVRKGSTADFESFWQLIEQTTKRDKFQSHPKSYYEKMLQVLATVDKLAKDYFFVELWLSEFEARPIAGALIGYFGDTATYLHGGSNYEYRNLMAPYLLHWKIIEQAKKEGYQYYDYWGIAPTQVKIEQRGWEGLTRFKRGFGGQEINYAGTFDFVYDKTWYTIYNLAKYLIK